MAEALGTAVLTLTVDDRQYNAGLQRAQNAAAGFRAALGQLGVATTIGGAAAFIATQINQLDAASAAVRTLGVDSDELGRRLRALSVELGNNISQVDLTKAAYDVASSGFATAADATEILRASALGAKGGFADVNDVASALTGVLNAYGLSASQATGIVDKFVQTQADGVITVRQYAAEIGNVSSIAAASGISLDELNAAIATATLRGVPVAQTFTGLRQAISSIIKPSEQAKDLAQSLGIDYSVTALQTKGFAGVLADVQAKTGGATDKLAILLGSVEAQAAVQPLLNDKLAKYNELLEKQAQAAGAAASASDINAKTISGGLTQIGNGFSNLATTLDTTLSPLFAGFIKDINQILIKLNQVSSLAPDKVLAREKQATNLVAENLGPLGIKGSGFFGAVQVQFDGKTFKGSATGVRESIIQYLLNKDLAEINKGSSQPKPVKNPTPQVIQKPPEVVDANELLKAQVKAENDILAPSRERLSDLQATVGLQGAALELTKQQLAIDKARAEEAKAIAEYDKTLSASGFNREDPAVIDAAARLEAAGNNFKSALIEGSTAVIDAGKELRKDAEELASSLSNLRASNFKYLTKQEQIRAFRNARDAASVEANRAGVVFRTSGTLQEMTRDFQGFADFRRQERELVSQIEQNKKAQELQEKLNTSMSKLVDKDWNVYVNVAANGASQIYGDVVNSAVSP